MELQVVGDIAQLGEQQTEVMPFHGISGGLKFNPGCPHHVVEQ